MHPARQGGGIGGGANAFQHLQVRPGDEAVGLSRDQNQPFQRRVSFELGDDALELVGHLCLEGIYGCVTVIDDRNGDAIAANLEVEYAAVSCAIVHDFRVRRRQSRSRIIAAAVAPAPHTLISP